MGRRRIWRWVALLWSLRMIAVLIVRSQNSDRSLMDARTARTSSPRRLWSWWQRLDALDDDEDPGGCWMPTRRVGISSLPGALAEILISLPPSDPASWNLFSWSGHWHHIGSIHCISQTYRLATRRSISDRKPTGGQVNVIAGRKQRRTLLATTGLPLHGSMDQAWL